MMTLVYADSRQWEWLDLLTHALWDLERLSREQVPQLWRLL